MSQISITGASTGTATFTIESPATSTNRTLTLPDNTGTIVTQNSTPAFASTIGVGGATAAASGAGITFPATQSASSDANTLDDYEEGTFTPTVAGSSVAGTASYTTQTGSYTKVGRSVQFNIYLKWTGGTGSGNMEFRGLPFISSLDSAVSIGFFINIVLSASNVAVAVTGATTAIIYPYQYPLSGGANTAVAYDAAGEICLTGNYFV
jgi:hypothetical protein